MRKKKQSRKNNRVLISKRFVPWGRTLSTSDYHLPHSRDAGNMKNKRTVVVIETNSKNELAVVPLSGKKGNNRTQLKNYQQGNSYFKHFVEVVDHAGKPIIVGEKFRENHKNQDVAHSDVYKIRKKVFENSAPSRDNIDKITGFRNRTKK